MNQIWAHLIYASVLYMLINLLNLYKLKCKLVNLTEIFRNENKESVFFFRDVASVEVWSLRANVTLILNDIMSRRIR